MSPATRQCVILSNLHGLNKNSKPLLKDHVISRLGLEFDVSHALKRSSSLSRRNKRDKNLETDANTQFKLSLIFFLIAGYVTVIPSRVS